MVRFFDKVRTSFKSKDNLINQNNHLKGQLFKNSLLKRRSPASLGLMSGTVVKNGLFEPLVDTRLLIWAAENNWMLGTAIDKVQIETTKEGWEWKPKFVAKCANCKTTYDEAEPEACEECGGTTFIKPNKKQLKYINQLFEKPNTDQDGRVEKTFKDILSDLCHYNQTIDDYYLETSLNRWGNPAEIFPLSSEQIRIAVDDTTKGMFCPECYEPDQTYSDRKTTCPECGEELRETMYVQLEGNTKNIEARWDSKSVLHSNSRAWGNRVYGIPKIWSVWAVAQTLKWMEYYNWSAYSQNKMPNSFTFFPGMSTTQVNKMIEDVVTFKEANPQIRKDVWMGSDSGVSPPVQVQTMFSMKDMMSIESAHFYREAIAIRYGVSLQMVGIETPGKLGNSETSAGVSYDTIVETQRQLSEFINCKLVPLFVYPEPITDWEFALISPQKEDKQADATLKATSIAGVVSLRASGIDAILNEQTFEIEIRDQPAPKDQMPFDPMQFSKALTPRGIPSAVATDGLATIEDAFTKELIADYEAALKGITASNLSKSQRLAQVETLKEALVVKLSQHAEALYTGAYMKGLMEEVGMFGEDRLVRFTQVDVNALEAMKSQPKGMFDAIKTFPQDEIEKFRTIIEESYATPGGFDLPSMVKKMEEATGGGRSNLERIARSETTRISNTGRAMQWEKYADPDAEEYYWNYGKSRHGHLTCPICKAIADGGTATVGKQTYGPYKGNPYTLKGLKEATNGFMTHPNCRCGASRNPKGRDA